MVSTKLVHNTLKHSHPLTYNSSSSVSSSSSSAAVTSLLRVGIPVLFTNGSARGGGTPLLSVASLVELCATEVDLSNWDDLAVAVGAGSSSTSVSLSDCSGVMGSGISSLDCSSALAWSISIWSLSDSGTTSGSAGCAGALRLDVRDAPALRVLVSAVLVFALEDCTAAARQCQYSVRHTRS